MNKVLFIIFVFILGCSNTDSLEYSKLTISYSHNATIDEGDWIEIDGHKIIHVSSSVEIDERTMPVSNIIVDKVEEKEWKAKVNYIGMGLNLARVVENLSNDEVKYIVEKGYDLTMLGKVKITRSDSKPIKIRFTEDYPILVTGEMN